MAKRKLLTRPALARALGVHQQTPVKWVAAGCPRARIGRRGVPSLFDLAAVRAWRDEREALARAARPLDPARELAAKLRAQTILLEHTYYERAAALVPAAEVERVWRDERAAVRAHLGKLPALYAERLVAAAAEGVGALEEALRLMVYATLRELAGEDHSGGRLDA